MNDFFNRFFTELGRGQGHFAITGTSSRSFTYRELDEQVSHYCEAISALAGRKKRIIAILSTRNTYNPALILATIRSGNAYLPIDPSNPVNRILEYLDGADPFGVLVEDKVFEDLHLKEQLNISAAHRLDGNYRFLILNSTAECIYEDTVQLLYTSGSTGRPKAVIHSYDSVAWFINWAVHTFKDAAGSKVLAVAPSSFDLSVFDMFFTLHTGSTLIIPSDEEIANIRLLAGIISRFQINLIYATPSFFKLLAENYSSQNHQYSHVEHVLLAGEVLTWQLLHSLRTMFGNASFFNLYGPTESNVCSYCPVNFADEGKFPGSVPIGRACSGVSLQLQPWAGHLQELIISGPSLFKGYLSERTLDPAPASYASGDIVQVHNGLLVFVKRADRMLKRNGYRIEPFEIEQCIGRLPGVERVEVGQTVRQGRTLLVAYVQTQVPYSKLQIKKHCLDHLPHYFLPDSIVITDTIPLNTNFKPDFTKLIETNSK